MKTELEQDRREKIDIGRQTPDNRPGKMDDNAVKAEPSDDAIIMRVRNGDVNAFELLMRRYTRWVFGIISKRMARAQVAATAEEVFIQAYQSLPLYRMNTSFKQWLALIARRCCCHYWRAVNRHPTCSMSNLNVQDTEKLEAVREEAACAAFHAETDSSVKCDSVRAAMDGLRVNDRHILNLLYLQDYSLQETAAILGCTLVNARVRACRARNALYTLMKLPTVTGKPLASIDPTVPSGAADQTLTFGKTLPMSVWRIPTNNPSRQNHYA